MTNLTLLKDSKCGNLAIVNFYDVAAIDFYKKFNIDSKSNDFVVCLILKNGTAIDIVICDNEPEAQDCLQQIADHFYLKEFTFHD